MQNLMSNGDDTNLIDITLLPRKVLEMQLGITDQVQMNDAINLYQSLRLKQIEQFDGDGPKKDSKETKPKSDPAPKKNDEHKNEKKVQPKEKKNESHKKTKNEEQKSKKIKEKEKKKEKPAPVKDDHIYIRKREGNFLYILAIAQVGAYTLILVSLCLYLYVRIYGQMTPTLSRLETLLVEKDFKAIIERIKDAKRN